MAKTLICLKCFEKFRPHEVWFRCQNRRAQGQTGHCPFEEDSKLHMQLPHAFPLHGFRSHFRALFSIPNECDCDVCYRNGYREISRKRICPYCHSPLLYDAGLIDEHIIAIVGGPGSGKTHTFPVLIQRCLKNTVRQDFNCIIRSADDETEEIFQRKYLTTLFELKTEIPPTLKDINERLNFRLTFNHKHPITGRKRLHSITLVFYDISGELLNRRDIIDNASRFLFHSSGIIYLVHPLHLPECRPRFTVKEREDIPLPAKLPDEILGNIVDEIRKETRVKTQKEIEIPLAVCLSQSDRIRDNNHTFGFDPSLFEPHRHRGRFDEHDFLVMDEAIREKLNEWGGTAGAVLGTAETDFKKTGFFMASALGNSPIEGRIEEEITPNRLEDPLLWILSEIGIIKKSNSNKREK